jgi:trafficking protein particle complex subunit 11
VQTFNSHNKRLSALYNGWGLGVDTPEYWHWLSRNHRNFADLLDISETVIVGDAEVQSGMKMISGDAIVTGDHVLHHPGYYYLVAANCVRHEHSRLIRKVSDRLWALMQGPKSEEEETSIDESLNEMMLQNLTSSAQHFVRRGQHRIAAYVELARCKSQHFAGEYEVVLEYVPRKVV